MRRIELEDHEDGDDGESKEGDDPLGGFPPVDHGGWVGMYGLVCMGWYVWIVERAGEKRGKCGEGECRVFLELHERGKKERQGFL